MPSITLPSGERCDAEIVVDLGVEKVVVPEPFFKKMVDGMYGRHGGTIPMPLPEISLAGFPVLPEI